MRRVRGNDRSMDEGLAASARREGNKTTRQLFPHYCPLPLSAAHRRGVRSYGLHGIQLGLLRCSRRRRLPVRRPAQHVGPLRRPWSCPLPARPLPARPAPPRPDATCPKPHGAELCIESIFHKENTFYIALACLSAASCREVRRREREKTGAHIHVVCK
jgi:hypothetical protein